MESLLLLRGEAEVTSLVTNCHLASCILLVLDIAKRACTWYVELSYRIIVSLLDKSVKSENRIREHTFHFVIRTSFPIYSFEICLNKA